jgi:hypothetical protein
MRQGWHIPRVSLSPPHKSIVYAYVCMCVYVCPTRALCMCMYACVCMYALREHCVCVCMYAFMGVSGLVYTTSKPQMLVPLHTCTHIYVFLALCAHACVCVFMFLCKLVCVYVSMHACMFLCLYACLHLFYFSMHACLRLCVVCCSASSQADPAKCESKSVALYYSTAISLIFVFAGLCLRRSSASRSRCLRNGLSQ